jgi:hypothetical protein
MVLPPDMCCFFFFLGHIHELRRVPFFEKAGIRFEPGVQRCEKS